MTDDLEVHVIITFFVLKNHAKTKRGDEAYRTILSTW